MPENKEEISICICTYKREESLKNLLHNISEQKTDNLFTIAVVVIDNDIEQSALEIVKEEQSKKNIRIKYECSPEKNLALIRNKSISLANGKYLTFIDDDEYPIKEWLLNLYNCIKKYRVSGALGPVVPDYQMTPPNWVIKGGFCERERFKTGTVLSWQQTRTGNAMLLASILKDGNFCFDERFKVGGEDDSLFNSLIKNGHIFVWCDEAEVLENVPSERLKLTYFLKRAKIIGYISTAYYKDNTLTFKNISIFLKSILALTIYTILLPFYFPLGFHKVVDLLIRLVHHLSVLGTFLNIIKYEKRDI